MSGIQNQAFDVQANQPWQSTGVTITPDVPITIAYQDGQWTANPNSNDHQSYDANGWPHHPVASDKTSYPLHGENEGALVGRIGEGKPFLIGNGPYTIPPSMIPSSGAMLELCINDDLTGEYGAGLQDNQGSVSMFVYDANTLPDTSEPLVHEPPQTSPGVPTTSLGPLQHLIGTWTNQNLPGTKVGGPQAPYSYNVMPLPQVDPSSPDGYILKNFKYYEELTFTAIHGNAPNRGGKGQQLAYTLFYEQRVYFAEGPNKDALIHAENGSLLLLVDTKQPLGPYGNGDQPGLGSRFVQDSVPPTQAYNLVKQVAVPHGNSILALGEYTSASAGTGLPIIPAVSPLPSGVSTTPYTSKSVGNPQPDLTADPNQALRNALKARPCTNFLHLGLSTANSKGAVTNIGFEQQHANVTCYDFDYWLESFDDGKGYTQLQYSQTITMMIPFQGDIIAFPHVTANTLTKKQ